MGNDTWSTYTGGNFGLIAVLLVAVLALPSLVYTGNYIISDAPAPKEGVEQPPRPDEPLSDGLLFIVLDGGKKSMINDLNYMPNLNEKKRTGTYFDILTNPLTMTASCVKEMATGIPSRPNEGLNNFHPEHPGTPDGWTIASQTDRNGDGVKDYRIGIVGDYVWGDLYSDNPDVNFMRHRYGHADYYQGDIESFETINSWLDGEVPASNSRPEKVYEEPPNIIIAHLSGLDSVGHRYGVKDSPEYEEKLRWLDENFAVIFEKVPDSWTVVVTSDHGLTDNGQHGSPDSEIREVNAYMWGPNIVQNYHYPEQIDQRDLATLPSLLFSLPLPHAIHGRFPLDALDITDEHKLELDQWNWDATIARNNWMKDNGHTYIEDINANSIQWGKINYEEIGLRPSDLGLTAVMFVALLFGLNLVARNLGFSSLVRQYGLTILGGAFGFSLILSYNRDTFAASYYLLGFLLPIGCLAACVLCLVKRNKNQKELTGLVLVSFFCMLMFTETRLSALNFLLLGLMLYVCLFKKTDHGNPTRFAKFTLAIVLTPIVLLSHLRIFYWSMPRWMIGFSIQQDVLSIVVNTMLIGFGLMFYHRYNKISDSQQKTIAVFCLFLLIPFFMVLENNALDWMLIIGLMVSFGYAAYRLPLESYHGLKLGTLAVFYWLTMSWGGYAGAISMILFTSFKLILESDLAPLFIKKENWEHEIPRMILLMVLPLAFWFVWWTALGQIGGLLHPRDVDPGYLYLNGGYIGDRFSPSNAWVGFMGGGPIIAMSLLWWNMFHKSGFPMNYLFAFLTLRIAFLALQLSISPNLPRLVFKVSWDILLCITFLGFCFYVLALESIKRKLSHSNAAESERVAV